MLNPLDLSQVSFVLTPAALLAELEERFPPSPPQQHETHEQMLWRGGQVSVVEWIRSRLQEDG